MRLEERYKNEICSLMHSKFKYKSVMQIPKPVKVVINMGIGDAKENSKAIANTCDVLASITGQRPLITKAKKSVANFKLRQGMNVGCKVTLRRSRMYEFLDKLVNVSLPRVRDFRGISSNSFDSRGNYSLGVKEQIVFPEVEYDKIDKIRGMDIIIVTSASSDVEAKELLLLLGFPFKD